MKPHSLFARFHSRERLLGRRTAAMCSFVISNKISTALSSNIYRSSHSTMIWTAVAALQALHKHLNHFHPKTNYKHQGSDHINQLIIHEIISCIQYFFSFNFFSYVSSSLVVVDVGENLWYFASHMAKIFYGVTLTFYIYLAMK